jgi:hypothetical protein
LVRSPWTLIVFLEPGRHVWLGVGALLSGWLGLFGLLGRRCFLGRECLVFALARQEIQFLAEGVGAKEGISARRRVGPGPHMKEGVGQVRDLVIGV